MTGAVPAGELGPPDARARNRNDFEKADRIVAMYNFSSREDAERAHEVARIALRNATPSPQPVAEVEQIIQAIGLNDDDTAPSDDYRQGVRDCIETIRVLWPNAALSALGGRA